MSGTLPDLGNDRPFSLLHARIVGRRSSPPVSNRRPEWPPYDELRKATPSRLGPRDIRH